MSYESFIKALARRDVFRIRPGLGRIRKVLAALGSPQDRVPALLIAGTNGKGSVAAALESVLRASGYKTGLYTSPHLIHLLERIKINGQPIREHTFLTAGRDIRSAEAKVRVKLTYFEFLTAAAFHVFAQAAVEIAVIECGMGGRWDATNVIRSPLLSILTSVGLDHTDYLGKTLEEIARHKCGIFRRGTIALSGVQGSPKTVVANEARLKQCTLLQLGRDFKIQRIPFGLSGGFQLHNAAIVLAALQELTKQAWVIPKDTMQAALRHVEWPGRFQVITSPRGPTVLLDGAHNPSAMKMLLQALRSSVYRKAPKTFIFSAFKDKDIPSMGRMISRVADEVCLCPLSGHRAASLNDLRKAIHAPRIPVRTFHDFESAYLASRRDTPKDGLIVITGSLSLVGTALQTIGTNPTSRAIHV